MHSSESQPKLFRRVALAGGPIAGALVFFAARGMPGELEGHPSAIAWTAAITVWCAAWWMTEPVPIPVTSLLPLALFPLIGVLTPQEVAAAFGDPLVLLMMGGFMLSTAMQRSGVHRRIAMRMIHLVGGESSRHLIFGFMAASWLLSMWISNAATTLMLLPIALAAVENAGDRRVRTRLLLGIAYAASLGGIVTPIGTPPNLVFLKNYKLSFGIEPAFTDWMLWALPVSLLMLPITALWLTRGVKQNEQFTLPPMGPMRREESRTLMVFIVTALLWVTRKQPFGGWSALSIAGTPLSSANDACVAMLAVVAMFLIPRGTDNADDSPAGAAITTNEAPNDASTPSERRRLESGALLDWDTAASIQWGILLLFAGGIAIATAFGKSGLSNALGAHLAEITVLPTVVMIAIICLAVTFLTEVTSNTATTTLLMPILAAAAIAANMDPKLMMVPATLSASFAFMLPVATPPNAIVFAGSELTGREMAREGLVLNLIGAAVITVRCCFL